MKKLSLRRHQPCQRHVDELSVLTDRCQRAAHIASNLIWAALLDPKGKLHDRGFEGKLVLIDLEE